MPEAVKKKGLYRPIMVVRIYKMYRAGLAYKDILTDLGIGNDTFWRWVTKYPEIRQAMDMAKAERKVDKEQDVLKDWVWRRLSPDMRKLWKDIGSWDKDPDGLAKIELALTDAGKRVRQQLFLYALTKFHFSPSLAMHRVNLSKRELDNWLLDPGFATLVEEIQWHKGNFFEEYLVKLVREGNASAVLFANRTYNRSRGYGVSTQVDVNVNGNITHGVLDLAELLPSLSEATRLELMGAIRNREEQASRQNRVLAPSELIDKKIIELATAQENDDVPIS